MEKQQKKRIRRYISWALIVVVVALLAFLPMIASNRETASGPQASILSVQAERRDISAQILGGGTLAVEDAVAISIPSAVKVTEYLVANGDIVVQGQGVASVDRVSVMTAITQVQETLEYLRDEIDEAESDTADSEVTATAGGTVKIICGAEGETVRDVMLRDGALAVLSLDGLMAVQIERGTDLAGGDTVCVTLPDGSETEGRVESNIQGVLTVTIEDDGYAPGEEVRVTTEDGNRIGTGVLYIHSQWNVVAYSGTISDVCVSEGDTVSAGKTLFTLDDTGHTAAFEALTRQHREYEALMLQLFRMYQSETVTAPADGMITGVDETGAFMLADGGAGWTVSLLANAPNGDDETGYVNYIGQVAEVGIDGLILNMNPQPLTVTDYKDLSSLPLDTTLMTENVVYTSSAPVYELSGEEWVQAGADSIRQGDILLFAGDSAGNIVWIVRVSSGTVQPEEPDPTEPSDSTEPTTPEDSGDPTEPSSPGTNTPQGGTSYPGFGGGTQEETFTLYTLDTVTIASVTGQELVTIQITIDELDISKIYLGQQATVTVDALTGEKFPARITGISSSGENEGGNSKFTVEVTVDKTSDMLPGMNASVAISCQTTADVVCIPVAALTETGTQTLVYTGYDEQTGEFTGPTPVTAGASDGEYVQILSGIGEGQTIYYPYYDTLVISNAPESGSSFPFGR